MTNPTSICPKCGGNTECQPDLIGKDPRSVGYHAYCKQCQVHISNATDPKDRVMVWENLGSNIYPNDISRLKKIIPESMNTANRKRRNPSMCSENSEDALTWSIFNYLEEKDLISRAYNYFTGEEVQGNCEIYYWGYNDKYPESKLITEYYKTLKDAGEPKWQGGYSEPDILLFNPSHGLINIEVKYRSPNDGKLGNRNDKGYEGRRKRAQKMLDIGSSFVMKQNASDWIWYELLRMWVPGCVVADTMKLKAFTLINLLPNAMLEKGKGKVGSDMNECIKQNNSFKFIQVTWEEFAQEIDSWNAISDEGFWDYRKRKIPGIIQTK